MATNRRYHDGCAIATALDLVGERWAMLVVRELLLGPKRFTDLQDGLPGAGPKILAQRLRELEGAGILRRRTLAPPASSQVYELTEWGACLEGVIVALGRWGADAPEPSGDHVGPDSAMLKLRSFFQPEQSWTATYEVRLGRHRFTVRVADGTLADVSRGEPHGRPDAVIDTDSDTLDDVIGDDEAFTTAIDSGWLTVTGDDTAARLLFASTRF
ncbi:winged helix-turn-helix transcriptional regulator [Actinophytocola algeriensis]|uniref:DNA-binding HxlR family transcriptional regulator n=1 Tax=Actinophytocola algeriensis TaxID=1768010 RepID=A0A7W7VF08_9PSEU|nr:winged helix-turn-helix transcriptional regulator [Actinophytocola algeriensis]MBB4907694.1 DNA-binding HxlR family transcriptional regulator [Actinophytocola algeriensis]MBE1479724.1 DNA-binding HxlR family transcriptional regulator [Actinophytocola algeriensis]